MPSISNAAIQQIFQSATQNVTSVLRAAEINSGNTSGYDENVSKLKDALTDWVNISKEAAQMHIPLNWDEDPIIGWESTLAGFSWLPPNFLKKCKANFSWVMANANITVSTSKTTSQPPGFSEDSGEVEIDGAGDTPPSRKRNRTATRTNLSKDEDWSPATPVKRSARKPVPKVSWGKREQPTFNPKRHVWNKMKCTRCAQRARAPERPCFSFKVGPKRCALCVFDNARCHPSDTEETGGLEATSPQEAISKAGAPQALMVPGTGDAISISSPSNPPSTFPPNSGGTLTAQSLIASLWPSGSVPSLAPSSPSPFLVLPGSPHVGGQLVNPNHLHRSPLSTIGLDVAAEIQGLYSQAYWMQENAKEMMRRVQELEAFLVKRSSV